MPGGVASIGQIDSYLICTTPRTGSTLLCGLMASTTVAGRPESYFREPDEQLWAHNSAWRAWFASVGIEAHVVRYEDLDADPVGVARDVLGFLGLKLPPGGRIKTRHRRLADELSAEWIDRYRAESRTIRQRAPAERRGRPCPPDS